MSAQATPQNIEELLPFYVNGTLDDAERDLVDAALRDTPALDRDVTFLRNLRDEMQAEEAGHSPGQFGLARLMRDIDAETAAPAPRRQSVILPMALAAAVAMVAVIGTQSLLVPTTDPVYEQASGEVGIAGDAAFTVTFRPDATEAQISGLMQELGLVIVDGPSAIGLYRLAPLDDADIDALAAALAAQDAVIERVDLFE